MAVILHEKKLDFDPGVSSVGRFE